MKNYRPAGIAIAVLFMLLFLGALGLRIWASGKSTETIGPDHLAASQDRVYVHVNGDLFVLSEAGVSLERKKIEPLVHGKFIIDMRVLRDGRLLLAKTRPAGIEVCETQYWQCEPLARNATSRISNQFKVLADEDSGTLFITDSDAHKAWTLPLAGGEPQSLSATSILRRPNDIAMDADGRLWIADSGNRRIVALERRHDGSWEENRYHDARNKLAREKRDWPMMLVQGADGNWWVTQPTDLGGNGDVLVYHPENGVQARIELPEDAYPTDMASLGTDMLVTDMDAFRIYRIDTATHAIGEFGDAAFREQMGRGGERKARFVMLVDYSLYGMIGFAALMILAAFWASPREKRWSPDVVAAWTGPGLGPSAAPAPVLKEVHWLRTNSKAEKQLRWMKPMMYAFPVMFVVTLGILYFVMFGSAEGADMTPEKLEKAGRMKEKFEQMALMTLFVSVCVPIMGLTALRTLMHRLGTDGHRLFVRLANGKKITLAPEQLVYTTRHIAFRDYVFAVQTGKGLSLYADGEINTFIAPLLVRAKKVGHWDMFRYQLGHREPTLMASLIFTVVLTLLMAATGTWREIIPWCG